MLMSRSGPDVDVAVFAAIRRFPNDTSSSSDDCPPRRVIPRKGAFVSSDSLSAKKGREAALISGARSLNLQVSLQLGELTVFMKTVLAFPNRGYIQKLMKKRTSRQNRVARPTETHANPPTWGPVWYCRTRGSGDRERRRLEWMRRSGERRGRLTKRSKVLGEDIMSSRVGVPGLLSALCYPTIGRTSGKTSDEQPSRLGPCAVGPRPSTPAWPTRSAC